MTVAEHSTSTPAVQPGAEPPLRVAFFFYSLGYLRFFDHVITTLIDRGHSVHLLVERDFGRPREQAWLAEMRDRPGFSYMVTDALFRDRWSAIARFLRKSADYFYFGSDLVVRTPFLAERAERRAPPVMRRVRHLPVMRFDPLRRCVWHLLMALERALPTIKEVEREIESIRPDVLALSPHLYPGGLHLEYVRAADRLGVRSCVCIASWDNLSSKQQIRVVPDRLVVWNEVQKQEAMELHAIPERSIVVTGAQSFDQWFGWRPRPREEFCAVIGLDPEQPYVLYVGASLAPAEITEAEYVRDVWIPELRRDPRLARASVLIRPHPHRAQLWAETDLGDLENVVVWPRGDREMPVDVNSRADYFDSIFHSATVFGINTSAMIDAAVVGRTVNTMFVPQFADSQVGVFHFDYLAREDGGLLKVAESYDDLRQQVLAAIEGRDAEGEERRQRFLEEFVRPHGMESPAGAAVVGTIVELAKLGPARARVLPRIAPLRIFLWTALGLDEAIRPLRPRIKRVRKTGWRKILRRARKRLRRASFGVARRLLRVVRLLRPRRPSRQTRKQVRHLNKQARRARKQVRRSVIRALRKLRVLRAPRSS